MSIYYKKGRRSAKEWMKYEGVKESKELKFIKKQLINSKGNICAICGKSIDNMKDCTIDHIRPISKGGLTTVDNCRLAHSYCNKKRGNSDSFGDQHFDQKML